MAVPLQIPSTRNWLHDVADMYSEQFVRRAHPKVMTWPLVEKDLICFSIITTYFVFINYLGPAIMKGRKPFDLRWLMVPYNILLVIGNFYIFYEYARIRWSGGADIQCDTVYTTLDFKRDPNKYRLAEITWYFYITKYIELIDTVFFVLRKKDRQLSRLHIIHHTTVPLIVLFMLRSEPGGYNSFFPLANSFVHCIMYTYYGISALGDNVTIHLRFKRYVTVTQLIQFILVMYYFLSRPFYGCNWHWLIGGTNLFIAVFFFVLFCNFYWHEYVTNREDMLMKQNGATEACGDFEDQDGAAKRDGVKKRAPHKRIL